LVISERWMLKYSIDSVYFHEKDHSIPSISIHEFKSKHILVKQWRIDCKNYGEINCQKTDYINHERQIFYICNLISIAEQLGIYPIQLRMDKSYILNNEPHNLTNDQLLCYNLLQTLKSVVSGKVYQSSFKTYHSGILFAWATIGKFEPLFLQENIGSVNVLINWSLKSKNFYYCNSRNSIESITAYYSIYLISRIVGYQNLKRFSQSSSPENLTDLSLFYLTSEITVHRMYIQGNMMLPENLRDQGIITSWDDFSLTFDYRQISFFPLTTITLPLIMPKWTDKICQLGYESISILAVSKSPDVDEVFEKIIDMEVNCPKSILFHWTILQKYIE